jgi:hypothetical protein
MAGVTNAIIKAGENALARGGAQATSKVATGALARGLTGAGISSLAKMAGSTLDGILGPSSGVKLAQANIVPVTLAERTTQALGQPLTTIGQVMENADYTLPQIKADKGLSKKNLALVESGAREAYDLTNPLEEATTLGITSKSSLPVLNRQQYYDDTLGRIIGKDGSRTGNVSRADIPEYMQSHLSDKVEPMNDSTLRELFGDNTSDISDLYNKYGELAQSANANEIFTPENIDNGMALMGNPKKADEITQDFADRVFGNKRDIKVTGTSSKAKNVKVSRQKANMAAEDVKVETPKTTNPMLADEIADLKAKVSAAGGGSGIGGGTATEIPGADGFNVKLKTGDTTTVKVGNGATGSTRQQRAVRKLDDMTAKGMNASSKQYKNIVGKSGSIDGHYKTVAERIRAENIDQANVANKAQSALALREDIKQQGLQYAEQNGVTIDLSGIDNTIGLSATQKRKLAELGLGLDNMVGGSGVVTPTQAEEIYKTLRDYAYNWSDSKDALTKVAGNACEKEANAVRDLIDNTMDNINVDYKTPLVEGAAANGEDPAYLRKVAAKKDFKFSDLRKDQSDWITIEDLSGNKIKEGPTINLFGTDTGINNPLTAGAEKIKEKIYERQAYGGGAGGNSGGGSVPPTGSTGPENNINFETVGRTGTLGNLLGRAKNAGLVGAGVLGGMMLGGGGGGAGGSNDWANIGTETDATTQASVDPYKQLTIGGYTYDQLENGYTAALMAGDTKAAQMIANMIGMLDDKIKRYQEEQKATGTSGTASKQKAALNVLSGLMNNYQAQGPIGGRFTQFMNAITGGSYSPEVAAYDTGAAGSLGTIIKALGDTGALSEGDQKRALELLPKTTDSEAAAKLKYQQLVQILKGAGAQ